VGPKASSTHIHSACRAIVGLFRHSQCLQVHSFSRSFRRDHDSRHFSPRRESFDLRGRESLDLRPMHSNTRGSFPESKHMRQVISADLESAEALVEHYLVEVGALHIPWM
jgi:hypothetical protein